MDNPILLSVTSEDTPQRLDSFVASKTNLTRSQVQKKISKELVKVNNAPTSCDYRIKAMDVISIYTEQTTDPSIIPEPLPIKIHYSDDFIAVVDKPAGMVVYPAAGHDRGTLINGIYYHCCKLAQAGLPLRPGIVHRLDKDTSGVMVVALEDSAYYNLVEQFRQRSIHRRYIAIVYGNPKTETGEITSPIGRSLKDRKKMSVRTKNGKEAITRWRILQRLNGASLVELRLGTGRTHQIRVHMSSLGHPILGDSVYGSKTWVERNNRRYHIKRQMLHAETIGFLHPRDNKYMEFHSEIPEDMNECLTNLK